MTLTSGLESEPEPVSLRLAWFAYEFQNSQGYTVRPYLNNKEKKESRSDQTGTLDDCPSDTEKIVRSTCSAQYRLPETEDVQ